MAMSEQKYISWDKLMAKRLKKRYQQAVENGEKDFTFEGNEFVTNFAKYLLEYLESRLGKL